MFLTKVAKLCEVSPKAFILSNSLATSSSTSFRSGLSMKSWSLSHVLIIPIYLTLLKGTSVLSGGGGGVMLSEGGIQPCFLHRV